ncbi:DNA ligase D [Bacillus weihaiensis]|uniref:DNA ligase (ATP) n=1 Tax=Bacillus weihaiensis TaxID=1547283 RepID=A0A1L3MTB8_9BACI|nr:DNA ligase D [Bacillus weihaiensis]APH05577.1 DNA ligase D [Bacillus weihaiensis]
MKPMLPTLQSSLPYQNEWIYETKYDGFRGILSITSTTISLTSRNEKSLNHSFPEIIETVEAILPSLSSLVPLTIDGEIVQLRNNHASDFETIQIRGRLRSTEKIRILSKEAPCSFLAFDLLEVRGSLITNQPLENRKHQLRDLFESLQLPLTVRKSNDNILQYVPYSTNYSELWEEISLKGGEGIIAKHKNSKWESGHRSKQWIKVKNYKRAHCFITGYDKENGYFHLGVFRNGVIIQVGVVSHGMSSDERSALLTIISENKGKENDFFIEIAPAIIVEIQFLSLYKEQLREPSFSGFRFDKQIEECSWDMLLLSTAPIHKEVVITHPDKPLFKTVDVKKEKYLSYLFQISDYMLPFINDRLLTVIRFPHGMFGEAFYQKNCPDYAPDFIKRAHSEDIEYIVCDSLSSLLWLGNQLAFEFHIPFQTINSKNPIEIVFDLDPPSREYFHLAVKAAQEMKKIFDQFQLKTFPKLSGNKGLQIHIPLTKNSLTYDQTRVFTQFIAEYLVTTFPDDFTVERMKKNRGNRLYLDYIQHAEGKTIIAPYSLRGKNDGAFIAAPLHWEEVNDELNIEQFTMDYVLDRIKTLECPFKEYYTSPQDSMIEPIIRKILTE